MASREISDDEAQFFHENGYLIVRGLLQGEELSRIQTAMRELYEYGASEVRQDPDYAYGTGHISGNKTLARVDYVIDKKDDMKVLLGHPFILRSTEKLMGADLIPTWDSMVLKAPGEGIIVPWHRDAGTEQVGDKSIFNVDFYLDRSTEENCVWIIPGSNKWPKGQAQSWIETHRAQSTAAEFRASGAIPALMEPGDVLFHDILVLHGSPSSTSQALRRVVYYEFRTAHVEDAIGPHVPAYIPLKQRVLLACIERRKAASYVRDSEEPFNYRPQFPYNNVTLAPGEELETFRYAHRDYWRR